MTISRAMRALYQRVALKSRHRCGYCWTSESIVGAPMELDHLIPESKGGATEEDNLWLACPPCNAHKADRVVARDPISGRVVRLFNPRRQIWDSHFHWSDSGDHIIGVTPAGRATVEALQLNRVALVAARKIWVAVGWHPPVD
jgi:hypothetical protein